MDRPLFPERPIASPGCTVVPEGGGGHGAAHPAQVRAAVVREHTLGRGCLRSLTFLSMVRTLPLHGLHTFDAALKGATMRARTALIGSLALVWSLSGSAQSRQPIPSSEIEDKVLGWIKVYDYKGATLPIKLDARVYSPAQLSIAQQFANWMQASYLPKGALGDVLQIRNAKLSAYNQNTAAHPTATARSPSSMCSSCTARTRRSSR